MMRNPFIKIVLKLIITGIPLYLLMAFYVITDPFKVVKTYDYCIPVIPAPVGLNMDHITIHDFLRQYPEYHYNSFTFGNSRVRCYRINHWKEALGSDASCFHFDTPRESIYGIQKKLEFLDKRHVDVKNALIVLDNTTLGETYNLVNDHLYIKDPLLSGGSNAQYQFNFFTSYLDFNFLFPYIDLKWSGKLKAYMLNTIVFNGLYQAYDCTINEITFSKVDSLIAANPPAYYNPGFINIFEKRLPGDHYEDATIFDTQISMLTAIKNLLIKNKTAYKIVISPGYDQLKFNQQDLAMLKQIFGKENVYDFTGKSNLTEDYHNFYEPLHYRPNVSDSIIKIIYKGGKSKV